MHIYLDSKGDVGAGAQQAGLGVQQAGVAVQQAGLGVQRLLEASGERECYRANRGGDTFGTHAVAPPRDRDCRDSVPI